MEMDKNAALFHQSAIELKMPITRLEKEIAAFKITLGKHIFFFRGGDTPYNCSSASHIARNKYCVNKLLERDGIPVPKATAIVDWEYSTETLAKKISELSFPLVAKPTQYSYEGKGVLCNINNIDQLKNYLSQAFNENTSVISIEEFHANLKCYRILVFFGKVIGIVERIPATLIGDGNSSLEQLIVQQNIEREQLIASIPLPPIQIDQEIEIRLKELAIDLTYIPQKNESIQLCYTANASRGGTMHSYPGSYICPENAALAIKAAKILNLNNVGFDIVCQDIMKPMTEGNGVFIEANDNPDLLIHERATDGISNRVSKIMIGKLIKKHPFLYWFHRIKRQLTKNKAV